MSEATRTDILIAGGGFAGLGLAVALKDALGGAFAVTVVDPTLGAGPSRDGRASAIAAAARRFFERIGAWDAVAAEAQPILDMVVTDSRLDDPIRPSFLTFDGEVAPGEPFAHMIENQSLINALTARAEALGVGLVGNGTSVVQLRHEDEACVANLSSAQDISARLVVAADGARSRLREAAGIAMQGWDYGQSGIVTTVEHERDHGGRAEEHFLPAGPFAILPLKGRRSSIVWTERQADVPALLGGGPEDALAEVERRFGLTLGRLALETGLRALPLAMRIARAFVAERLALVGDAAHVIHPIAGQGLNLGVRDVAALAECVIDAARLGLDIGAPTVLERYQRWRRFDTVTMGVATDGLNRLFSNENAPLRFLRDVGLGLVDRMPAAKRFFIREAAGLTGETPRLLR